MEIISRTREPYGGLDVIFCEVDIPTNLVEYVQEVADRAIVSFTLIRKNATPEEYVRYVIENHPDQWIFLVYGASGYFTCYGVEEGQLEGVPIAVRSLGVYSIDKEHGYGGYWEYKSTLQPGPNPLPIRLVS